MRTSRTNVIALIAIAWLSTAHAPNGTAAEDSDAKSVKPKTETSEKHKPIDAQKDDAVKASKEPKEIRSKASSTKTDEEPRHRGPMPHGPAHLDREHDGTPKGRPEMHDGHHGPMPGDGGREHAFDRPQRGSGRGPSHASREHDGGPKGRPEMRDRHHGPMPGERGREHAFHGPQRGPGNGPSHFAHDRQAPQHRRPAMHHGERGSKFSRQKFSRHSMHRENFSRHAHEQMRDRSHGERERNQGGERMSERRHPSNAEKRSLHDRKQSSKRGEHRHGHHSSGRRH